MNQSQFTNEQIEARREYLRGQVMKTLEQAPEGLTVACIAFRMGKTIGHISPRVSELKSAGKVKVVGSKPTKGCSAKIYASF